jgi:hypothetical protein
MYENTAIHISFFRNLGYKEPVEELEKRLIVYQQQQRQRQEQ